MDHDGYLYGALCQLRVLFATYIIEQRLPRLSLSLFVLHAADENEKYRKISK